MPTLNPPKSISRRKELREDKVVTFYARAWQFFDQNRTLVYGILGALVLVVILAIGWVWYGNQRALEAQQHLGQIVTEYEAGNYQTALDGTEGQPGLVSIADRFGRTDAGNLARFYAADAYFQLGQFEQAATYFRRFSKGEGILGASAYAGEAAALEEQEEYQRAAELYRRAALHHENPAISPQYLIHAGRAYESAGEFGSALEAYRMIADRFADVSESVNVEAHIARAETLRERSQ